MLMDGHLLPVAETRWVEERALALGFDLCGVAPAEKFPELEHYSDWIEAGYGGDMQYLKDPRRLDPRESMTGVRSLIVCALNYNVNLPYSTEAHAGGDPKAWISRYAWGDDYHDVMQGKLNLLATEMRAHFLEPFELRSYADTGPIHERTAAKYAGLGWLGKNTLLINQTRGSWLFLGAVLTSLPLNPTLGSAEAPPADRCGSCTRCIEACPTQAILEPYLLDATRCISYLTIEFRGSISEEFREPMGRHVFGCDICQDVCPWNRKSPRTPLKEFQPRTFAESDSERGSLFLPDLFSIANLSAEEFRDRFRGSPVKRTKWQGLVRNACMAIGNSQVEPGSVWYQKVSAVLGRLSRIEDPVVSESALWALSRIQRASR
jgi:epoxyqueuosine reductase